MTVKKVEKIGMITASALGVLAVLLGAFAAHALQLEAPQAKWFETGNRYHFYHTLAILAIVFLPLNGLSKCWVIGFWLIGTIGFSGSLYLAATGIVQWFWLTPIGGVFLLIGWCLLLINGLYGLYLKSD